MEASIINESIINKTMQRRDLDRPECRVVLAELFGLMRRLEARRRKAESCSARGPRDAAAHTSTDARPASEGLGVQARCERSSEKSPAAYGSEQGPSCQDPPGYSSWYGRIDGWPSAWEHVNRGEAYEPLPGNPDEIRVPWFLLWQIAWIIAHTPLRSGGRVLDMGGAGSLFSCYLASRGSDVHSIDLDERLCRLGERTAQTMGWRVSTRRMDMRRLDYPDGFFDHVFSVCVFEHLPVSGRIQCNEEVARVLRPGGTAAFTFDYSDPQSFGRIDSPEDVERQFVGPSGLAVRGNARFLDAGERQLEPPQCFGFGRFSRWTAKLRAMLTGSLSRERLAAGRTSYTIGALFLEKPA